MSLGPNNFNATISYDSVFCFIGDDETGGFLSTSATNEPYLWVFMVKIDGEIFQQNGNYLEPPNGNWDAITGPPVFFFPPGGHGNLQTGIASGETLRIPRALGGHDFKMKSIPISVADQRLTSIPGVIISAAVLLEENTYPPDEDILSAHQKVVSLIRSTVINTVQSLGLAGLAADILIESGIDLESSLDENVNAIQEAATRILQRRLKPVQDIFELAATGSALKTILDNVGISVVGAVDPDDVLGSHVRVYVQPELAATFTNRYGNNQPGLLSTTASLWKPPKWAFNLHGVAFAHRKWVARSPAGALPSNPRLQVTCSWKRHMSDGPHIIAIGGTDNGQNWMLYRDRAADLIRKGEKKFFVRANALPGIEVGLVAVHGGYQPGTGKRWYFVRTEGDGHPDNNLVNLPEMPIDFLPVQEVLWY